MRARMVVAVLALALAACSGAKDEQTSSVGGASPTTRARPRARTLPAGTDFVVQSQVAISSGVNKVGDPVTARFAAPVMNGNDTVIPVGSSLAGTVTALKKSTSAGAAGQLQLDFTEVRVGSTSHPINLTVTGVSSHLATPGVTTDDALKVAAGAAAGAIAGRIIGGDKTGARIGAGVGTAAGAVYANRSRDREIIMSSGATIHVVLADAWTLR